MSVTWLSVKSVNGKLESSSSYISMIHFPLEAIKRIQTSGLLLSETFSLYNPPLAITLHSWLMKDHLYGSVVYEAAGSLPADNTNRPTEINCHTDCNKLTLKSCGLNCGAGNFYFYFQGKGSTMPYCTSVYGNCFVSNLFYYIYNAKRLSMWYKSPQKPLPFHNSNQNVIKLNREVLHCILCCAIVRLHLSYKLQIDLMSFKLQIMSSSCRANWGLPVVDQQQSGYINCVVYSKCNKNKRVMVVRFTWVTTLYLWSCIYCIHLFLLICSQGLQSIPACTS